MISDFEDNGSNSLDERALDDLFERLYEKIRRLAARVRWNSSNPTLNPTALAHEAYLKMRNQQSNSGVTSYEAIIPSLANAMQQILVDAARRKMAQKRIVTAWPEPDALPVEEAVTVATALEDLERENARQAQIVRCRFLLGMTNDETAAALRLGRRTVEREWQLAKTYLRTRIETKG
jgi:RNA polymerase sigma factor (TIGR02999 family)